MKLKKLYKNWTVHNLLAHPLMEILYLMSFGKLQHLGDKIHDSTLPESETLDKTHRT